MGILMHRCIYDIAPGYLKDSILSVSGVHFLFLHEVLALAIFLYHTQTVNYLNNHFYTMVL